MQSFQLNILSADHEVFNGSVQKISLPSVKGVMTLLLDHMPIISALASGEILLWLGDEAVASRVIPIIGGFVEMRDNICTVFVDYTNKNADDVLGELIGSLAV